MVVLLAAAAYLVHTRRPSLIQTDEFGQVHVFPAWFRPKGYVYLLSGEHGWSTADEESARDLARSNHIVLGIDTPAFMTLQNQIGSGCTYMPGLLEDYSRKWQRVANISRYLSPALLGSSAGASLVYQAQVQAPPTAFSAAIAVNPEAVIGLQRPFCDHPPAAPNSAGQPVPTDPPGRNIPLRVVLDSTASAAQRQFVASILKAVAPAQGADLPLHRIYSQTLSDLEVEAARSGVADLPLAEVPSPAGCNHGFAILYSGDGGWRDLDRGLADILASKGMSVVGVDVLRYYWKEKLPAEAARDLERIMRHYQASWQCQQVVLIGFSFGADVLPFLVTRLPADLKTHVQLITLLSPERTTAFEVEVNGWLGGKPKTGVPIGPEMKKISGIPVQCFYGQDEGADSLCTDSTAGALTVVAQSGGHHFDNNYDHLADEILAAVPH
jgi:type IV secretory pathway VirJ component